MFARKTWPTNHYSTWTPKAAGGWPMTVSNGCFNAGGGHQGAPSAPVSPTQAGGRISFIGSTKATLSRVLGEKGVVLTAEAAARLDALPERFMDFIAAPDGLDVAA